jgi:hypothetical protein
MLSWIDNHAAAIQAITSAVIVVLTVILARTTMRSTAITREALRITRDQFDREWWIDLHVRILEFELPGNRAEDSVVRITNLGRASVMVEIARLRSSSSIGGVSVQVPMDRVIAGGLADEIPFASLREALNHCFVPGHPETARSQEWQVVRQSLQISLQCYSARQRYETDWVTFSVEFHTHPTHGSGIFKIGMKS